MRRAFLAALALAGCSGPPAAPVAPVEVASAPAALPAVDAGAPAPLTTPPGCAALTVASRTSLGPGAPGFYYGDRAALDRSTRGAVTAFQLDHDGPAVVARMAPDGSPAGRTEIPLPKTRDRAHLHGAVRGDDLVLTSEVYVGTQDADIELALLDHSDRLVWRTFVDPDPALDDSPVVAWGGGSIGVAWLRGKYPSTTTVRVALVDPRSGKAGVVRELPFEGRPGTPALVWDGTGYAVAWHDLTGMRNGRGLLFARVTTKGEVTGPRVVVPQGTNPDLCVTPDGFALAYDDDDNSVGGANVHVLRLDKEGAPRGAPWTLGEHPDPAANPRKPRVAWTGHALAVAWEVQFHASMFRLHGPEAYVALLGPDGAATPPTRLEVEGSAELPALVQTGSDSLAVYTRNRLAQAKTADVVSARLSCLATPPAEPKDATPGPCDVHRTPASGALAYGPNVLLSLAPLPEGGYAVLRTLHEPVTPKASFALVDRDLRQVGDATPVPSPAGVFNASVAARAGGWAIGWGTNDGKVEAMLFDRAGKATAGPVVVDATSAYGKIAIAATAAGVMLAWGTDKGIRTALLDANGAVARAASLLGKGLDGGDCALAPLVGGGLGLVFAGMGAHTETSVLRFARLDGQGRASGPAVMVSGGEGFLRAPEAVGTMGGGLVIGASGPFAREVVLLELDGQGKVVAPERTMLESYGLAGYGVQAGPGGVRVFGVDKDGMAERQVCGR